jgi:hypothetical protein
MTIRLALVLAVLGICPITAFGQRSGAAVRGPVPVTFMFEAYGMGCQSGVPFAGDRVRETTRTQPDGTRVSQTFPTERMARDAQGRMHEERAFGSTVSIVIIRDCVAGVAYILDTQAKVTHRVALQPMPTREERMAAQPAPPPQVAANPKPQTTSEDLGTQVIEGLMAHGTRSGVLYPVGYQGSQNPVGSVNEVWTSTELNVPLLQAQSTGGLHPLDNTVRLINISRSELDPALFTPPADYSVVEESGPRVTLHFTAR